MKKIIFILTLIICQLSYAQSKSFTVSGEIPGSDSEEISISYKDSKGVYFSATTKVSDGAFSYTNNNINEMVMVSMSLRPKDRRNPSFRSFGGSSTLQFFAYPGANVKFSGKVEDFVLAYPSGDDANNGLTKYYKSVHPIMNEMVMLNSKISKNKDTSSAEFKNTKQLVNKLGQDLQNAKLKFIKENPSTVMSAWLLQDMMLRRDIENKEAIVLFKNIDHKKLKDNSYYKDAAARVSGVSSTAIGELAPEIKSSHTYDEKLFSLSSLKGKYVVLDFWGTWCGPCISGMPHMKEYLEKYKSKMEMVGIASESDDGSKWKEFLKKNSDYNWHQVLSRNDEDFILKYNVAGFPTKIIIDPSGKIIARYVGEGEDIYIKLDELLQ
ncbi:MAG: AhpC/TSA family protein [Chitinophagaceae bacterium]|nr:MAG: AhpC/TSA family protein [Chitinophagaceae bacterium]